MPGEVDRDVYPEPPRQTPVHQYLSSLPDPLIVINGVFNFVIDKPVTIFHDWMIRQREKNKIYYYHRIFQRVPDLSQCLEDDILCRFEAEMQWRRDVQVDREIVKIMRERYMACITREGANAQQNCLGIKEEYAQACRGYKSRYDDLGANGNARRCLMKQKARMIEERKAAAAAEA
ncbi:NADH dehydrogenase [ubiquinone] 1 beta subcomplex subunit 10 [Pyxicephalus adspersus]|uniref:NADH dehydrogenase [ubiquinone] 1 beta subcomplex subunit 10 n=1 Tax=Pyxicephalus adspersus TaxID=30357 RepID=A0AAV2ZX62_PYXAD|nr:TPA: hypothetical protein GDO54_015155 [Pyxicephalus adspersus]